MVTIYDEWAGNRVSAAGRDILARSGQTPVSPGTSTEWDMEDLQAPPARFIGAAIVGPRGCTQGRSEGRPKKGRAITGEDSTRWSGISGDKITELGVCRGRPSAPMPGPRHR